jgi:hypothetical protein
MASSQGPYLQLAAFCDRVIEERDGTISLIRVVDRVTNYATAPFAPEKMPPFPYWLTLVLGFKSGKARGSYPVRIEIEEPSGIRRKWTELTVVFEGDDDRGQNLVLRFQMTFHDAGLYWFDIYLENTLMTRVPWRVTYIRTIPPPPPSVSPGPIEQEVP